MDKTRRSLWPPLITDYPLGLFQSNSIRLDATSQLKLTEPSNDPKVIKFCSTKDTANFSNNLLLSNLSRFLNVCPPYSKRACNFIFRFWHSFSECSNAEAEIMTGIGSKGLYENTCLVTGTDFLC